MMKSPFEDIDKAMLPFFTDAFAVKTKDGKKTTLHVSLFFSMTDDPITDAAMEADRKTVILACREEDWPFISKNLSRGDEITDAKTLKKYTVTTVEDDNVIGKTIYAREV